MIGVAWSALRKSATIRSVACSVVRLAARVLRGATLERQRADDDRGHRERGDDEQLDADVGSVVRIGRHRVELACATTRRQFER